MKVKYVGPHDAVLVPLPDGRELTVTHDEEIDTSDEHAKGLLEQTMNWQPAQAAKRPERKE